MAFAKTVAKMVAALERYHAEPVIQHVLRGEPVYVGTADRPVAAWHYRPAGRVATTALVIVPPFGYEAVSAHRALRVLAIRAAEAGLDAWRIDLDGTGDSAGDERDPDRVAAWTASIAAAIDAAYAHGVGRVILAGVRLGATLAVQLAAQRSDVAGVVAIAPVVAGKKWLREMRALQGALGLAPPPATTPPADGHGDEALGFWIAAATRDAIAALDLDKAEQVPAKVCVIDREDLPASDKWLAALRARGTDVTHAKLPGYVEMVLDAHKTEIPDAIIAATVERATAWSEGAEAKPDAHPTRQRIARIGDVVEEPVEIAGLAAIATRPRRDPRPRRALVLLNAGAVRSVGPNRMYVAIARRCAAEGTLVVRADLSGLGDSPAMLGEPDRVVYMDTAAAEIAGLVAWCRSAGADRVVLGGLCSGGYYALQRAVAGEPLAGLIVINPGAPDVATHRATEDAERYRHAVRDPEKWKKLFAGGVDLRRLASSLLTRATDRATAAVELVARRLGKPLPTDLGAQLTALVKRGVTPTFIFSGGEPDLVMFREHVGPLLDKLEHAGLTLHVVEGADHTFTAMWSQAALVDQVAAALRRLG
jgi:pimeloyl-ACP methyl ester carboxylesterase